MQVIGEVVRSYIDLRTAQALKANAAHDARAQAEIARLIADRLRVGLASRVDLMRAETQVRGSVAAIPAFEREAAAASFRLSLLVGQQPEVLDPRLREPGQLPADDVEIAAGLRPELLPRRPDIRDRKSTRLNSSH